MKFDFSHSLDLYINMIEFNIGFIVLSIKALDDMKDDTQLKIYNKYYYDDSCLFSAVGEKILSIFKAKNELILEFSNNHNLYIDLEDSNKNLLSFMASIDKDSKAISKSSRIIILKKLELFFKYLVKETSDKRVDKIINRMSSKNYSNAKIADILDLDEEYINKVTSKESTINNDFIF
jgi:hypothetical protein